MKQFVLYTHKVHSDRFVLHRKNKEKYKRTMPFYTMLSLSLPDLHDAINRIHMGHDVTKYVGDYLAEFDTIEELLANYPELFI